MQVLLYSISQGIVWKPGIIEKICFIYLTCFEKLENTKNNENQLFVYKMEKMLVVVNVVSSKVVVIEKKF